MKAIVIILWWQYTQHQGSQHELQNFDTTRCCCCWVSNFHGCCFKPSSFLQCKNRVHPNAQYNHHLAGRYFKIPRSPSLVDILWAYDTGTFGMAISREDEESKCSNHCPDLGSLPPFEEWHAVDNFILTFSNHPHP